MNGFVTTAATPAMADVRCSTERLQVLFATNYDLVWRFIRRLGVPREAVDDAAQDAFLVVARRLGEIDFGKEKSFLFSTAMRVAADTRRRTKRSTMNDEAALDRLHDTRPSADVLIDHERARAVCDRVLDAMPFELRAVFVLFQTEDMTMAEIATHLEIAPGTVASRIRRARALFEAEAARFERGSR